MCKHHWTRRGTIKDLQDELKMHAEFRKKQKESLEKHLEDNGVSRSAKAKIALQESQMNLLNTKLSEEQEKSSHWKTTLAERISDLWIYRSKNTRTAPCQADTVYDIVKNG